MLIVAQAGVNAKLSTVGRPRLPAHEEVQSPAACHCAILGACTFDIGMAPSLQRPLPEANHDGGALSGNSTAAPAKARGRTGGRPPALGADDPTAAKAMLEANGISVAEVAARLNVAPSTLYRHLPGGRGAVARHQ